MGRRIRAIAVLVCAGGTGACAAPLPLAEPTAAAAEAQTALVPVACRCDVLVHPSELDRYCADCVRREEREHEPPECPEWCHERHEVGLFLGYTTERGEGGGGTVGLDYSYRLSEYFGVGGFGEYIGGRVGAGALGAGLFVYPWRELIFFLGPGFEFSGGERPQMLLRVGALYMFPLGCGFKIGPSIYFDYVEDEGGLIVGGLTLSKGF